MADASHESIRLLTAADLSGSRLDAALDVFAAALGVAPRGQRVLSQGAAIQRHAERAGFAAFGAFDGRDRLVGFSYGYTSQPGLWWREQVAAALAADQRAEWLTDAFELVELHVHPAFQGHHLGSGLHDALLRNVVNKTALLSVMRRSERARQLYFSRGWQVLVDDLRFSSDPATPFSVLGLALSSNRYSCAGS
jgi:ribosomal protein S18 acetylase RimI-like enzyme